MIGVPVSHASNEEGVPVTLAQRLRLLIDLHTVEHGTEPTYTEVAESLEDRGVGLSRARWSYMLNGHRQVSDPELLDGLADFFEVNRAFIRGEGDMPERIQSQLELIRAMRVAKVRSFAARTLGDVSPQTLNAITRFLDEAAAQHERGV